MSRSLLLQQNQQELEKSVKSLVNYFRVSDTICYWEADDQSLAKLQYEKWMPVHNWMEKRGLKLKMTKGLMPIEQDASVCQKAEEILFGKNAFEFTSKSF